MVGGIGGGCSGGAAVGVDGDERGVHLLHHHAAVDHAAHDVGHTVELRHAGHRYSVTVSRIAPRHYRIQVDGQRLEVRGCDLWTFRGDQVVIKNSFWKIVE